MYQKKELNEKTVQDLKSIATEAGLAFDKKSKKEDLVKLILESEKVSETARDKKKELKGDLSSSSTNQVNEQKVHKPDFFNDIPELPSVYGKDKIVFMVRDPYWGFVYWELTDAKLSHFQAHHDEKFLRVYDISGTSAPEQSGSFFDIRLNGGANNWYIKFPSPNRTYIIDLGVFKDGKFVTILRSNAATTPRDEVSDQIDLEWMIPDDLFKKLLTASGAGQLFQQIGSQELMKFLAGNITEGQSMSSGLMPGSMSVPFGSSSPMGSSSKMS